MATTVHRSKDTTSQISNHDDKLLRLARNILRGCRVPFSPLSATGALSCCVTFFQILERQETTDKLFLVL